MSSHARLGQHFLKNKAAIKKIIVSLDLRDGDIIIEIGPGRGELTMPLLAECDKRHLKCKIVAIEKDPKLAKKFSENFQLPISNFQIICGDALKELPLIVEKWKLRFGNWKLVGNIPYYITGKLLRIISELKYKPALTVLMIQKEVAERIVAHPPRTNLLSAITQFWAKPEILMRLKPTDFDPPPEVDSGIIKLNLRTSQDLGSYDVQKYYEFCKIIFKQPRKTLLNNLAVGIKLNKTKLLEKLKAAGFNENTRPQELTIESIQKLVTVLYS